MDVQNAMLSLHPGDIPVVVSSSSPETDILGDCSARSNKTALDWKQQTTFRVKAKVSSAKLNCRYSAGRDADAAAFCPRCHSRYFLLRVFFVKTGSRS